MRSWVSSGRRLSDVCAVHAQQTRLLILAQSKRIFFLPLLAGLLSPGRWGWGLAGTTHVEHLFLPLRYQLRSPVVLRNERQYFNLFDIGAVLYLLLTLCSFGTSPQ